MANYFTVKFIIKQSSDMGVWKFAEVNVVVKNLCALSGGIVWHAQDYTISI